MPDSISVYNRLINLFKNNNSPIYQAMASEINIRELE